MEENFTYQSDCDLLCKGINLAGEMALKYFKKDLKIWIKEGQSPVSEADYAVDKILKEYFLKERPHYGWVSEESAEKKTAHSSKRTFIIDPIDGTRGYLNKSPIWCISAAIVENGEAVAGALYAPALNEFFKAFSKGGAYLNGFPLQKIEKQTKDNFSMIVPEDFFEEIQYSFDKKILLKDKLPSLAYCLSLFSKNELDFFLINKNCYDWDIAAVDIILRESGHELLDIENQTIRYNQGSNRQKYLCLAPSKYQKIFSDLAKKYYNLN